jgi:hypothetical protein
VYGLVIIHSLQEKLAKFWQLWCIVSTKKNLHQSCQILFCHPVAKIQPIIYFFKTLDGIFLEKEEKLKFLTFGFVGGRGRTSQIFEGKGTNLLCSHSLTSF